MPDICLCESKECPRYHECLRGEGIKREGVFTVSFLREICNENNNYECFYPIDGENKK